MAPAILFSAQIPPVFVTEIRDTLLSHELLSLVLTHTALSLGPMDLILEEVCQTILSQESLSPITSSRLVSLTLSSRRRSRILTSCATRRTREDLEGALAAREARLRGEDPGPRHQWWRL